ncbi:MAG TPA: PAS domain S-box protein [Methylomirabilota bacterium]|nr:PAS domain S-box protein [Methylomirabilota bacterium]
MSVALQIIDLGEFPSFLSPGSAAVRNATVLSLVVVCGLLVLLLVQQRKHARALERESKRHILGKQISAFGEKLAGSPPQELDATITGGLTSIVALLDADRLCWYEVAQDSAVLLHKHTGNVRQAPPSPQTIKPGDTPYMAQRLGNHEYVLLRSLKDLPASAQMDRKFLEGLGVKSLLLIPSRYSPRRNGVLGLASYNKEESWPEDVVSQLTVAANIVGAMLERKDAQAAKEESEERFRSLFAQASVGIALETVEGRILEVNPAFCAMLGYSAEEMKQLKCERISHPDDEALEKPLFEELRQGLCPSYTIEKRFYRKDGTEMWGRVNVSLLSLRADSPSLVLGMVSDCTAQRTAEDSLKQRDHELQRLAGHLIEAQEEERRRISRELHDDIGQRVALLACELDRQRLSRQQHGQEDGNGAVRAELDSIATDIHKLSHELHSASLRCGGLQVALKDLCRKYANNHNLEIDLQADDSEFKLPPDVALCLLRVAQESLANALKHARTNKVDVRLTQDGEKVHLVVQDFGQGFDPATQSGGIGLTSMRERLRLCGGVLRVKSSPNKGTEIAAEVTAPAKVAAAAAGD